MLKEYPNGKDTTGRVRQGTCGECSHPKKSERTGELVVAQIELLQLFKAAQLRRQGTWAAGMGIGHSIGF